MNVEIDVAVKVVGASVEEALARVTEKLMGIKPTEADRERYAKEYHSWNDKNYGEVNWSPVHIVQRTKDWKVQSELELRIRNV